MSLFEQAVVGVNGFAMWFSHKTGFGKWTVLNVQPCACDKNMSWQLRVRRHKMNRTHDGIDIDFKVGGVIDDTCEMRLDICKMMDGGCKPYMVQKEDSLPNAAKKYAPDNVKNLLTAAGLKDDFPIPIGDFHVDNYLLNLAELPKDGIYGEFGVDGYIVKGGVDVACVRLSLKYEAFDDDDPNSFRYG